MLFIINLHLFCLLLLQNLKIEVLLVRLYVNFVDLWVKCEDFQISTIKSFATNICLD